MLPGREQTLCCKDCIKLQAVQANRFLHFFLQHVRAQLPSFPERPFGKTLSTSGRSHFCISAGNRGGALLSAGLGGRMGSECCFRRDLGGGGPNGNVPGQFWGKIKCLGVGYF